MANAIRDRVTQRIVEEMEAGHLPWERPWDGRAEIEPARNAASGHSYRGVNVLLLWNAIRRCGFSCNRWLTFRQARTHTGGVRRGSRSTRIVFASAFIPPAERRRIEAGEIRADEAACRWHLRSYAVFNLDQCVDVPERLRPPVSPLHPGERVAGAERLIRQSGADIRVGGTDAFYHYQHDYIALPDSALFTRADDFYATALHELSHWTGHASRLNRRFGAVPPDRDYILEEMIAELSTAFLCAEFGIEPRSRHSDYLAYWIAMLRADSMLIFTCARQGSDAADYLQRLPGQGCAPAAGAQARRADPASYKSG